eukprot:TRINITY_DN1825_c0_g1_i2.p1 TRINITY_DN1825_c0_g1~~TRINITY_DN1825_c0_g1_i2.p1  ORF type:complete len:214 (-),score=23.35 TRINITY_DN1825_c0_g1_i2:23-664(-)
MISPTQMASSRTISDISTQTYTSCYCEENIYKLCEKVLDAGDPSKYYAVFVSNQKKEVLLFHQKAHKDGCNYVIWDYHVILLENNVDGESLIYDFDTLLPYPCKFETYFEKTFFEMPIKPRFHCSFRVVPARDFVEYFSSDRSHMLDTNGNFLMPPPPYPPIIKSESSNNLFSHYLDFSNKSLRPQYGQVLSRSEFAQFVNPNKSQTLPLLHK